MGAIITVVVSLSSEGLVKQRYFNLHFPKIQVILICISRGGRKKWKKQKKLSCIDCNVKKCNVKQNIENHKPYPGFCVSHNMDLKDRQMALDTYLGDEKDLKIMRASAEIEHDFYCQATRVEETIRWAKKTGCQEDRNCKLCGTLKGKPPAGRTFERIRL